MKKTSLLSLLCENVSLTTIVKILADSEYNYDVCKKGVELLANQGWKKNNFFDLLDQCKNPESLLRACIGFITLEGMDKNQIFKFLEANKYNQLLAELTINALPPKSLSQDELVLIMSKFNSELVYSACWTFVELNEETEDELADLLKKLGSGYQAKKMIAPYFKTKKNLLPIIKMLDRNKKETELMKTCFKKLGLDNLSDSELISIIKESKDCIDLCHEIIRHFKLQSSLWWVIAYYEYNYLISAFAIPRMDDENLIMIAVEKNISNPDVLNSAIPKLSEPNIMMVWERNLYEKRIYQIVADNLSLADKTEDELICLIVKEKTGNIICEACKPYFDLTTISSSNDQMIAFLKKTGFSNNACQTFLPLLKLEAQSESRVFVLIKKTGFNENICENLMSFISSDKNIIEIVQAKMYYDNNFWAKPFSDLLAKKSETEILEIVKLLYNYLEVCKIALDFLKTKAALTEICIRSNYNDEIMKIAKTKNEQS